MLLDSAGVLLGVGAALDDKAKAGQEQQSRRVAPSKEQEKVMRRYSLLTALVLLFALATWAQELRPLMVDPALPGASGTIGIGHDTSDNTYVTIQVKHLAKPDALQPAKTAYVVWIQPPGQLPEKHGVLEVNDKLEAKYTTTTHAKNFDVFVTAEDNPKATEPTGAHLLSGSK